MQRRIQVVRCAMFCVPMAICCSQAVAQVLMTGGNDFLPRPNRAATMHESWRLGDAEWIRAQAWSARLAAEARSLAIKAEAEAMQLREWRNEHLQAKFAAYEAEHEARQRRGRAALEAKQVQTLKATFCVIDAAAGSVRWPAALQGGDYAADCRAIDAAVSRRLRSETVPTHQEAVAVVQPLRDRLDAEYQQRKLSMTDLLAARKTLDGVQRELRSPRSTPSDSIAEAQ